MNYQAQILNKKLVGKVLIVEDDLDFGSWLKGKLESTGLTCLWAMSIEEAKTAFTKQIWHAVVTDIFFNNVPQGLELIKYIEPTGTPTIIISSAANFKIAKESMNHGASYLLEKPFNHEELLHVLNRCWEEHQNLNAIIERFLDIHNFTAKEKEVVRLLLKGLSNKEMAAIEGNADRTIKFHLTSIFEKCGVSSRTELINSIFPV